MKERDDEQFQDPKKEMIYESIDLDSGEKDGGKDLKKGTKLQKFLSKIDETLEQEMLIFLKVNQTHYEQNRPSQKISLYEDILFVWTFKKEEADLFNKKKKEAIEKITGELEEVTKRKKVTIKERIEKKLSNLSPDQLRGFMKAKKDISFADMKQGNSKKTVAPAKSLSFPNTNSVIDIDWDLAGSQNTANKAAPQREQNSDRFGRYCQERRNNSMQMSNQPANHIPPANPVPPANHLPPKTSGTKESLYKYGKKPINQRIYVCFSANTMEIGIFNKTSFQYFENKIEAARKGCKNPEKEGEENPLYQVVEEQKEGEMHMEIEDKSLKSNKRQSELKNPLMNKETVEAINNFFKEQSQPIPKQIEDHDFKVHIESVKLETSKALQHLESLDQTEQNLKQIEILKNYINKIDYLQNNKPQTTAEVEREWQTEGEQDLMDIQSSVEHGKRTISKVNRSSGYSSGKKTHGQFENYGKTQQKELSPAEPEAEYKQLLYSVNNNPAYLELIKEDDKLMNNYIWSTDEDNILFSFRFNPQSYHCEMSCLLRYKSLDIVFERYRFLQIDVDSKMVEELHKLDMPYRQTKPDENRENFERMVIQGQD